MSRSRNVTQLAVKRFRNDTAPEQFTLVTASGTAIDITGRSFRLAVDPSQSPADNLNNIYELTADIVDANAGIYEFPLTALQAQAAAGNYFFDIEMTYDNGGTNVTRTIAQGSWEIVEDITK